MRPKYPETLDVLLAVAAHAGTRGLVPDHDHGRLLSRLARFRLDEMDTDVASDLYEIIAKGLAERRPVRADFAAEWRKLSGRLAEKVQRDLTPDANGRSIAASDRLRRLRERDTE